MLRVQTYPSRFYLYILMYNIKLNHMGTQFEMNYDVFNEESTNEVNDEYTTRSKIQEVSQSLHFDNRFSKDNKGKNNYVVYTWKWY